VILRVLVFSWWIGPGLYREDAKTRRREEIAKFLVAALLGSWNPWRFFLLATNYTNQILESF